MTAMQNEANMQLEREKMQQDAQIQMQKMLMEFQLKQEQFVAEINLKREQLIAELQLKRELAEMGQKSENAQVSSDVRTGGEPG